MIKEITINKKYRVMGCDHTRTPLFIKNDYVFYEHDLNGIHCASKPCELFKSDVEEIPEEKVKWHKVIYKRKDAVRPSYCMMMFKSEEDFFAMNSNLKEDMDFFHMEEVENHLEKV